MAPKRGLPDPPRRGRFVGLGEPSRVEAKPKSKSKKKNQGEKKQRIEEQSSEVVIRQPPLPLQNENIEPPRVNNPLIGPGTVYHEFLKGRPLESFDGKSKQGEEVEVWLNNLDDYFSFIPLNEVQKAQSATFLLIGAARMWWDAEKKLNEWKKEDLTWEFMKGRIVDKYCSKQYFLGKLNDFLNVCQGGITVEAYQDKFLTLSKYGPKLSSEEIVSRFVQGLSEDI